MLEVFGWSKIHKNVLVWMVSLLIKGFDQSEKKAKKGKSGVPVTAF